MSRKVFVTFSINMLFAALLLLSPCSVRAVVSDVLDVEISEVSNKSKTTLNTCSTAVEFQKITQQSSFESLHLNRLDILPKKHEDLVLNPALFTRIRYVFNKGIPLYLLYQNVKRDF